MTIRLHVFPLSPRAFKVLFAAHQIGVDYELVMVNLAAGAQRTAEYTGINPNQRMPALEDGDFKLWESNAIVQYLACLKPETGYLPDGLKAADECGQVAVLGEAITGTRPAPSSCSNAS
jgi:glutathione S-transferase